MSCFSHLTNKGAVKWHALSYYLIRLKQVEIANSLSRGFPPGDDRVVGGAGWGQQWRRGDESRAVSLFDRLVQTQEILHAVYLTTLSVCTYHIKNHKCQERSQKKKALSFPSTLPELLTLIYAAQRSHWGERHTHFHVLQTNSELLSFYCCWWSALTHWNYCIHKHT